MNAPWDVSPDTLLAHYVTLAKIPAWRQYVWHRVNQLASDSPELYGTLPDKLTQAMKNGGAAQQPAPRA